WTCAAITTRISIRSAARRYSGDSRRLPISLRTMAGRSYSVSGRDSTRSMSGTGRDWTPSADWLPTITPSRYGSFNRDPDHEDGAALLRRARSVRQERGPGVTHGTAAGVPHQVLQPWRERHRGEFLRRCHQDDGHHLHHREGIHP